MIWAAEFSALNCCSSKYYTLATMTARMPLKGGALSFHDNLVQQDLNPNCTTLIKQATLAILLQAHETLNVATQLSHVFVS